VARIQYQSRQVRKNAPLKPELFFRPARIRGAPPSPLRYDAIAPKPKAKAEKRSFGATAAGALAIFHPQPTVETVYVYNEAPPQTDQRRLGDNTTL